MRAQRFYVVRGEAPDNFRGVASGCPLFRGKNVRESAVGNAKTVRCSEFRGGRFSEVANVLHKRDFQSVIATLSAVGSVSASRSVRSERFYCILMRSRVPRAANVLGAAQTETRSRVTFVASLQQVYTGRELG